MHAVFQTFEYLFCRINNEWSFDDSIAKYGCRVYAFDPTMTDTKDGYLRTPYIQFFQVGLADFDSEGTLGKTGRAAWKTRTLKTIITELRHDKASTFMNAFGSTTTKIFPSNHDICLWTK